MSGLRISTMFMQQQGLASLLRNQALLARTQNQLASGQRIMTAADAPADAAQALNIDQALTANTAYLSAIGALRGRLGLEENALSGAGDVLQHVRELALQANNGTQSDESRAAIAAEMRESLKQLVALANSGDGQGRYLFGGSRDSAAPFALAGSGASYAGDQSQRLVQIGESRTLADGDPGSEVFLRTRSGNGVFDVAAAPANAGTVAVTAAQAVDRSQYDGGAYSISFNAGAYEVRDAANVLVTSGAYQSGAAISFRGLSVTLEGAPVDGDVISVAPSAQQDVFASVQDLIAQVSAPLPATPAARAQAQTAMLDSLQALDGALGHLVDTRAGVGTRLAALDGAQDDLDGRALNLKQTLSSLRDLDYAEAATRLQSQLTALQVAQQTYASVQGLSLFDYLR